MVLLPVMMQTLFGYPSLQAGIALAPRGIGSFIGMPVVGLLTSRMDPRKLVIAGLVLGGVTLIWLGDLNLNAGYWEFFWPQVFQGFALGLLFVPLTTVAMADMPVTEVGNASSLFNLVRNIGSSVGIAAVGTLVTRARVFHFATLGEHLSPYNPAFQMYVERFKAAMTGRAIVSDQSATLAMAGMVQRQASLLAFIDVFRLLGIIFIVCVPLVFLMRRPKAGTSAAMAGE